MTHWLVAALVVACIIMCFWVAGGEEPFKEPFKSKSKVLGTMQYYGDSFSKAGGAPLSATACADNGPIKFIKSNALKKHPWIAVNTDTFGLSSDGTKFYKEGCGKCIEVQNALNGRTQKFLVVDKKGEKGVDMSQGGWDSLGMSYAKGSGPVNVKEVPC
jgi:hypothetical protein